MPSLLIVLFTKIHHECGMLLHVSIHHDYRHKFMSWTLFISWNFQVLLHFIFCRIYTPTFTWLNSQSIPKIFSLKHTNRRPRKTLKPSTNSKIRSPMLATTIHRSNMFQPQWKNSFERANSLRMHSTVKTSVKTFSVMGEMRLDGRFGELVKPHYFLMSNTELTIISFIRNECAVELIIKSSLSIKKITVQRNKIK